MISTSGTSSGRSAPRRGARSRRAAGLGERPASAGRLSFGSRQRHGSRGRHREILRGQMSQENVEIVRRGYEAYARGDVAAMLADVDPGMITYREEPDGATFTGRDGLLAAIAEWVEDFDEFKIAAEELIDANDRQVIVHVHQSATGSQSGAPIEGDFWFVHTLDDSKVTRLDMFASKARALDAAGLSERPVSDGA